MLSERELNGLHKVSRTAVRIGLKQLDALGILEGRKSSTRLLGNSAESLFSNFLVFQPPAERDFRKVIEVGCIDAVIANADGKHVNELRRINAGVISSDADMNEVAAADYQFHKCMIGIAGNSLVSSLYGGMKDKLMLVLRVGKDVESGRRIAFNTHNRIIEAVR